MTIHDPHSACPLRVAPLVQEGGGGGGGGGAIKWRIALPDERGPEMRPGLTALRPIRCKLFVSMHVELDSRG